ncbi:MAG: hypothetical protein GWO16_15785, partial [Gammaproteobacteria bacterium]|nr:hypothetical protein [Gammaproteobacteria bacterium]NIR99302.1 hypothetical protein [Gammaproteobacteria bacterium]NIT64975.1 hypothetical protein [Gammaproteobacteria bacterium]NIV21992.1 hypothetical protein [Gammaproteobacteria bacterium]NIY33554.1 hypothetical protein [Gammaproteobacteria bacterium]
FAVAEGNSEIVIGTVTGSNIANILLILGLTAIFARNFTITWDLLHGDLPMLFGSLLLLVFVVYPLSAADIATYMSAAEGAPQGLRAAVYPLEGLLLLFGYVLYLHYYG